MRLVGSLLRLPVILLVIFLAGNGFGYFDGAPVMTLYPDDPPLKATFYFSSGGPLERFTSKPEAWYALYRLPLFPNQRCAILLSHDDEPERIRVFALDRSPFDAVRMKFQLTMADTDWQPFRPHGSRTYEAVVGLPADSAVPGVYLLVEWTPKGRGDNPPPLLFQVLTADDSYMERRRPHTKWRIWGGSGSFKNQRPVILPVPRRTDGRMNIRTDELR